MRRRENLPSATAPSPGALYFPRSWFEPLRWEEVFAGRPAARGERLPDVGPVEVDLGCGKGGFLVWAARNWPATSFLGVDRLLGRLRKTAAKIERAGTTNVRLLRIESGYFVRYLAPAGSVAAYHIYFPDPWPKRRHQARRLFNEEFVRALHSSLARGGTANVATDDGDYAATMDGLLNAAAGFGVETPRTIPPEGRTEFERTFLATGCAIHRRCWRKR